MYQQPELLFDERSVNITWDVSMYANASDENLIPFTIIPEMRVVILRDINNVSVCQNRQ